jgi:hypothetical protein
VLPVYRPEPGDVFALQTSAPYPDDY